MKTLSLKLEDTIFSETEEIISQINKNRNRYINEAVEFYNQLNRRRIISKQLVMESGLVWGNSMDVLAEFERFNDED
ncbi:MAG: hypothetical protein KJ941_13255 [Bacteroidetes bacterium]|nr:hypothetical protein [Bacteroidota bacterium]